MVASKSRFGFASGGFESLGGVNVVYTFVFFVLFVWLVGCSFVWLFVCLFLFECVFCQIWFVGVWCLVFGDLWLICFVFFFFFLTEMCFFGVF